MTTNKPVSRQSRTREEVRKALGEQKPESDFERVGEILDGMIAPEEKTGVLQ